MFGNEEQYAKWENEISLNVEENRSLVGTLMMSDLIQTKRLDMEKLSWS